MSDKITPDIISDIFGIPRDGKNITEEDEGAEYSGQASVAFADKVKDVSTEISKIMPTKTEPVVANKTVTAEDALKQSVPVKTVKKVEEKPKAKEPFADLFADAGPVNTPVQTPVPVAVPAVVTTPVVPPVIIKDEAPKPLPVKDLQPKKVDKKEKGIEVTDTEKETIEDIEPWDGNSDRWLLRSPAPKYNRLYDEKTLILGDGPQSILQGGEINFKKYYDEIEELNINTTVKSFDLQEIHNKMQQVQQCRTRIEHIRLMVGRQYYHWERYLELFRGVLCRVEYDRGKQEGLNYEHLRDLEHYFCSLKHLHKSAEGVMRTLDGAFECLSRQVTVLLPMKEIDRFSSNTKENVSEARTQPKQSDTVKAKDATPMTDEMKKYDSLTHPSQESSKATNPSLGSGWDGL